jgi:hypothetical protein
VLFLTRFAKNNNAEKVNVQALILHICPHYEFDQSKNDKNGVKNIFEKEYRWYLTILSLSKSFQNFNKTLKIGVF